jgi:hypothetical protein
MHGISIWAMKICCSVLEVKKMLSDATTVLLPAHVGISRINKIEILELYCTGESLSS